MGRVLFALLVSAALGACSCSGDGGADGTDGGTLDGAVTGDGSLGDDGSVGGDGGGMDAAIAGFAVQPVADQTLDVVVGQAVPTVTYAATFNGNPVSVVWNVDRGEVASLDQAFAASSVLTPSMATGGVVTLTATYSGEVLTRKVLVRLQQAQNGPNNTPEETAQIAPDVPSITAGGGIGGVGGEGLGGTVTDPATMTALDNPSGDGAAKNLTMLYPYNSTVWPRGMLAPLLQWRWDAGDADAIKIELETSSGSYTWSGTFTRPAILAQTGGAFIRHPVPQDAWTAATNSAGGQDLNGAADTLTLRLTVAKDGVAYGPIEQTYRIAPARLAGTIYYQSYGTNLAKNYVENGVQFGGAVLSIKVGDTGPQLAAGKSGASSECRVCHSVAANGSRLVATNNASGFATNITPASLSEFTMSTMSWFPGITPDGALAWNPNAQLLDLDNNGAVVSTTGLDGITYVGTPAFSPNGTRVAFNPMSGANVAHAAQSLVVMDFDQSTRTFSNPVEVLETSGTAAQDRPGWPAFSPDGNTLVYQHQTAAGLDGNSHGDLHTRKGAKAYLSWVPADGGGASTRLANANGDGYLPTFPTGANMNCTADGAQVGNLEPQHSDDHNLNYEPTVNPIASGGYAWVVFTSRRMYGNVATIPPYCSDPRGVDLIQNITPKKLWVAAMDLNAPPGTDPSHPAFYLPAQELLAGNARGFWTLDPCRSDGDSCETGDQCCNGFCAQTDQGAFECTSVGGECSFSQEACDDSQPCCNPSDTCINGFCTPPVLQ